jgi:hypothetical protein
MADYIVEERLAHTINSELAARNLIDKLHLAQESARETYGTTINGVILTSYGDGVHTCGVKR